MVAGPRRAIEYESEGRHNQSRNQVWHFAIVSGLWQVCRWVAHSTLYTAQAIPAKIVGQGMCGQDLHWAHLKSLDPGKHTEERGELGSRIRVNYSLLIELKAFGIVIRP